MRRSEGSLRARLLGGDQQIDNRLAEGLASRLEGTESVEYRLTSGSAVSHEQGGDTHRAGAKGALLGVTDRKLVIVSDTGSEIEAVELPYTDLKSIEKSGLLWTTLSITVWGRGTYRFRTRQSGTAADAVDFVSEVSDIWQRAVASLQDARQHISELSGQFEAGDTDAAAESRGAILDHINTARQQEERAPQPVERAIDERAASVERELARARMEGRLHWGTSLGKTASELADDRRYDEAYETLERARSHVGTALRIALEWNLPETDRIRSARDSLSEQLWELGSQPLQRADEALERARAAETTHEALRRWEHALDCYRDALTAGWGMGVFDGDVDALRMQVEWLVGRVLWLRCRLADRYESERDAYRAEGAEAVALDRCETAWFHLDSAERLARQYLAGDAGELRERQRELAAAIEGE
jgi:hypothetical protein